MPSANKGAPGDSGDVMSPYLAGEKKKYNAAEIKRQKAMISIRLDKAFGEKIWSPNLPTRVRKAILEMLLAEGENEKSLLNAKRMIFEAHILYELGDSAPRFRKLHRMKRTQIIDLAIKNGIENIRQTIRPLFRSKRPVGRPPKAKPKTFKKPR
jgi:hypothetical protein